MQLAGFTNHKTPDHKEGIRLPKQVRYGERRSKIGEDTEREGERG